MIAIDKPGGDGQTPRAPHIPLRTAEGDSVKYPDVRHYIGGRFEEGGPRFLDVHNPADGSTISRVPLGDPQVMDRAVSAATRRCSNGI